MQTLLLTLIYIISCIPFYIYTIRGSKIGVRPDIWNFLFVFTPVLNTFIAVGTICIFCVYLILKLLDLPFIQKTIDKIFNYK